jgi:hypothetical protein
VTPGGWQWLVVRGLLVGFGWMTACYAFVASSTFASQHFLRPRVFPPLNLFGEWHAAVSCVWLALLIVHVWPGRRPGGARVLSYGLIAAAAAWTGWTAVDPILPALADSWRSLGVGALACLTAIGLAGLDMLRSIPQVFGAPGARAEADWMEFDSRLLRASAVAALASTSIWAALAAMRWRAAFEPDLLATGLGSAVLWSLLAHAVLLGAALVALALTSRLGGRTAVGQWAAVSVLLLLAITVLIERMLARALGTAGAGAPAVSAVTALSVVGVWAGIGAARLDSRGVRARSGLDVYLGIPARGGGRRVPTVVGLAAMAAGASVPIALASIADWDNLLLDGGVLTMWVVVFGWAYRRTPPGGPIPAWMLAVACAAPLAVHTAVVPSVDTERRLSRYGVYDPAYRLAGQWSRRPARTSAFTRYLRAHTGLTDVPLRAIDVDLVDPLLPAADPPHIFLFVVDSLRHDYLRPYSPAAWFTPHIAEFAADSVVFTNTFTRYGGTGLSVPAIWAGTALPHKQYAEPFHRMNTLEKLLEVNQYRRFIGLDSVMGPLLEPSPLIEALDRHLTTMDFELCRTLGELERKLSVRAGAGPVFAYSLPQDLHMSRLTRWSAPAGDFTGFFAPYAGRVQALDACFGRFVDALKRLGLYDRSLVVLTADHGEMLGEGGQHGHSYHLFPQVVRVPLIVHLPRGAAASGGVDPDAVSLTTDIVPTIYAALGYHPTAGHGLLGRPLVGQSEAERRTRRRGEYVLAASYGAVYAVVSRNGRRLYVADAVKDVEYLYERPPGGAWVERRPSPDRQAIARFAIRRYLDEIARVYHVPDRR